jgi:prepilin-type N-terminal cleavage/methylation domain-containing protein
MNRRAPVKRGFTLIEIMIVVAIMGIILAMGLPPLVRSARKEGMRKATSDFLDACDNARKMAILTGITAEVVIHPQQGSISVNRQPDDFASAQGNLTTFATPTSELPGAVPAGTSLPPAFSAQLPANVSIELLGVNFLEYQEAIEARVRFYPNGMSDEFTVILRSDAGEVRKISLESVTALAEVTLIR